MNYGFLVALDKGAAFAFEVQLWVVDGGPFQSLRPIAPHVRRVLNFDQILAIQGKTVLDTLPKSMRLTSKLKIFCSEKYRKNSSSRRFARENHISYFQSCNETHTLKIGGSILHGQRFEVRLKLFLVDV